jgi:flagellar hook-basal body complex protein FliE
MSGINAIDWKRGDVDGFAVKPRKSEGVWDQFSGMLTQQIKETERMRTESNELNQKALLGNAGVSLHEAQIATARTELHTRFMIEVRNKALEAYKQVMSMPV